MVDVVQRTSPYAKTMQEMIHDLIAMWSQLIEQRTTQITDHTNGCGTDLILSMIVQCFIDERKDMLGIFVEVDSQD